MHSALNLSAPSFKQTFPPRKSPLSEHNSFFPDLFWQFANRINIIFVNHKDVLEKYFFFLKGLFWSQVYILLI